MAAPPGTSVGFGVSAGFGASVGDVAGGGGAAGGMAGCGAGAGGAAGGTLTGGVVTETGAGGVPAAAGAPGAGGVIAVFCPSMSDAFSASKSPWVIRNVPVFPSAVVYQSSSSDGFPIVSLLVFLSARV